MLHLWIKSMTAVIVSIYFIFVSLFCHAANSSLNSKEHIGDPSIVRLQQERKQLTKEEEEEIKKYGYTALEIITYAKANSLPGEKDWSGTFQSVSLGSDGHIMALKFIQKQKWYYKSYQDLITYNGIKPGDIRSKRQMTFFFPPSWHQDAILGISYLESEKVKKDEASWIYRTKLRKIRHFASGSKEDHIANTNLTYDDWRRRTPWEEDHKILGVDHFNGKECFVIESKHRLDPKYYLSKRLSWIEKENFLNLHEEQFNREGKLFFMNNKTWERIKPWDYWSITRHNVINLAIKSRTVLEVFDQIFDQGWEEREFTLNKLQKPSFWRDVHNHSMRNYEKPEDFPAEPQVRWEFWEKLGVKPEMVK